MVPRTAGSATPDGGEFERFFVAHHRDLARFAYALTGDHEDADDIAADALVAAWRRWDRVMEVDHPLAYVRRIVVNLCAGTVRRGIRERRRSSLLGPLAGWIHTPDVGARLDLEAAIVTLPPRRRACVVLRHVYGLSPAEIAETLGISEGAAKSQTSKGLAQLRRLLGPGYRPGWAPAPSQTRPGPIAEATVERTTGVTE